MVNVSPVTLMSFGIGGLFTLMMSMTADVCDYDELKNGMPRKRSFIRSRLLVDGKAGHITRIIFKWGYFKLHRI